MSIPDTMMNDDIRNSTHYMAYLALSTNTEVNVPKVSKGKSKGLMGKRKPDVDVHKEKKNDVTTTKASKLDYRIQQHSKGSSEGSSIIPKVPNEPKDISGSLRSSLSASDDEIEDISEKQAGEDEPVVDQAGTELAKGAQAKVNVPDPTIPNPSSSLTLSSATYDSEPLKDKDTAGSSKKGKAPSQPSTTDKTVNADETIHEAAMETEEPVVDDAVNAEEQPQDDVAPKRDTSIWFKQDIVVKPETPDPYWHKEPNADDAPEHNWFNELVNAEKDLVTFDDLMGSTIDFTKNNIELEYNLEQCYLALSDQLDWANPEGEKCPYDMSKPQPIQGPSGHLTIPVDFFFNNDLEDLKT
ncbi:hypothetical protein Tco_0878178 [Tanacetum coccineum]|uniref:Uncharacterized protein n=1 Tax=Tanacetum coccineum TaxID=301880 RepID=A0ABQ5C067_9ASTR